MPEPTRGVRSRARTIRTAIGFAALMGAIALLIFQAVRFQDPADEDGSMVAPLEVLLEAEADAAEDR